MYSDSPSGNLEERLRAALADRFEIEKEMPGGGMSRVFLAREISLDRRVVIKVLPPELAAEVNRDRFKQEVQFAARLQHPLIVPLHAAGEIQGLLYYTMPFIEGESLKADLARGRRFTEDEAVEILIDVADALATAHEAGIVHRDIKPANILRSGSHAVVTDFGVAKALSDALRERTSAGITTSGVAIGTPAYMAPEQIAGDPAADHRVDIYAIGLLAYELLSGRAPFSGPSPQAMLAAHLTGRAEPLIRTRSDLSPALNALVERCMEKDASRRPGSAAAVLEVLRTIAFSSGTRRARPIGSPRKWGLAAVGVVVVSMATVAWIAVRNQRAQSAASAAQLTAVGDSMRRADSLLRATVLASAADSLRRATATRDEQRRMQRVTDSIAASLQQRTDSALKQLQQAAPRPQILPLISNAGRGTDAASQMTPEAFQARALSMGPPRRVFVELGSAMIRSPDVVLRAGVLRDSVIKRLSGSALGRFRPIPTDSAQLALTRGRAFDSLAKWLNVEVFVTIRTSTIRSDSVLWQLDIRDHSAITAYETRSVTTRSPGPGESLVFDMTKLIDQAVRQLAEVDRAPRRKS